MGGIYYPPYTHAFAFIVPTDHGITKPCWVVTGIQLNRSTKVLYGTIGIQNFTEKYVKGVIENVRQEEISCTLCQLHEVEDKDHFHFQCPCYVYRRKNCLNKIFDKHHTLDDERR